METNQQPDELRIEQEFSSFPDFLDYSRDKIYRKILAAFDDLYKTGLKEKKLLIHARVDGTDFDTCFNISREDPELYKDVIIKYFAEIEEYETCGKILKMYS